MLVAGMTLLLTMLFGGGNISAFIVEDLPKEIKANIEDKERQKEILVNVKDYDKEFKKSQKELNRVKKDLKKLNLDRVGSKEEIEGKLGEAAAIWKSLLESGIEHRTEVTNMLEEEEWQEIIANSMEEFDKKEIKSQEKAYNGFEKKWATLSSTVLKEIPDEDRRLKIEKEFDGFKGLMKQYVDANMKRTVRENQVYADRSASEAELTAALSDIENVRLSLFDSFVNLHFELVELTTDEEWTKISKAVNKLY